MNIGVVSYGAGAACYLVLFLLLLTSWRGRLKGALLVIAVFITFIWALVSACYASNATRNIDLLYRISEVARSIAWLAFLVKLLDPILVNKRTQSVARRFLYPALFVIAAFILLVDIAPHWFNANLISVDLQILGHICLSIGGLALIEHLFRNTRSERRWAVKYLYLGIGTLFAYDFFLFSDALLFKRIDSSIWHARGLINAMVVPLIAVATARNPAWSLDIFVSRRMVTHSVTIFGAGLYLLMMAGAGYYIRIYGGTWGTIVQLVFLVGAGMLLLVLMFSEKLRATIKVLLSKHFFNYKYDYREEWLKFTHILSANDPHEPLRERAVRALADIVHSNGGSLWTQTNGHHFILTANWNFAAQDLIDQADYGNLIDFISHRQWIIDLDVARNEPKRYASLVLPEWLKEMQQAWLVVPLLHGDNLYGFIVLARPRVRQQLNWEDWDLLKTAGRQAASYLVLLETTEALMDSRQFEAFNRLSAYVVHDLKNIVAQLSLVVANATRHKTNPAFVEDAIRTVENATTRMNRMLTQLRKGSSTVDDISLFDIVKVLSEVVKARSTRKPLPVLTTIDPGLKLQANQDKFAAIMEHLIQNAQEATDENGSVEIKTYQHNDKIIIEVADNGCGMDERFIREQLFRPFTTTKGNAGMGIGVYESREFVQDLGGEIDVISKPGLGTTFFLRLPSSDKPNAHLLDAQLNEEKL